MTISLDQIEPVAEITTEADHTIVIGPEIVNDGRYYVSKLKDGSIVLTPVEAIAEEERAVWENPLVREALARGMAQAEHGELLDWDDVFGDDK